MNEDLIAWCIVCCPLPFSLCHCMDSLQQIFVLQSRHTKTQKRVCFIDELLGNVTLEIMGGKKTRKQILWAFYTGTVLVVTEHLGHVYWSVLCGLQKDLFQENPCLFLPRIHGVTQVLLDDVTLLILSMVDFCK